MKERRILSSLPLAILLVAPSAHAANPQQDLASLRTKAEQGDSIAQNNLGTIYEKGLMGVTKDKGRGRQVVHQGSGSGVRRSATQPVFFACIIPEGSERR